MSSGGGLVFVMLGVGIGAQALIDDAGESAFEAAQGFGLGISACEAFAVVGVPGAGGQPDLGDSDAVQSGVELAVA
jgi:hypothetical protein